MQRRRGVLSLLMMVALALPAWATPPAMRVTRDAAGKARLLQTSVSHFVLKGGQKVDLVAALHIAEGNYYKTLNQRFKSYDAVLYELILSGNRGDVTGPIVIPHDEQGGSELSQVQLKLCHMLGLKFQLFSVDYSAPNFRHADLTSSEFQAMMAKNGESTGDLLMRVIKVALMNAGSQSSDDQELEQIDVFALLFRDPTPQEQRVLRRVFAASFPQIEQITSEVQGTTLIAGRNRRAIEVLEQQVKAGRNHLAIFYGAGHMVDMEQRLLRLGAHLEGREWLDAWHLDR